MTKDRIPDAVDTLVVTGLAVPDLAAAAAIVARLGLMEAEAARQAMLRAPVPLVRRVAPFTGRRLIAVLAGHGVEAALAGPGAAPPLPRLCDVAVHVADPGCIPAVAAAILPLVGGDAGVIEARLASGPAVLLEQVGPVAVGALRRMAGPGATVLASDRGLARYDLETGGMSVMARRSLLRELRRLGYGEPGTLSLPRQAVERLMERFGRAGLQPLDRAFLRHDVVLTCWAESPRARMALTRLAGIPPEEINRRLAELPLRLDTGLGAARAAEAVQAYAAAGLSTEIRPAPLPADPEPGRRRPAR